MTPIAGLPSLRELLGQLFRLPELKPRKRQIPVRLRRLLEAGLSFRWLDRAPEKGLGRRQLRRLARRRPREERLEAERQVRLRRLFAASDARQTKRGRRRQARARRRQEARP